MKLNKLIHRPILASVISLIIVICGAVAAFNLPVSQFPNISPPSISIRAQFPGADAETSARVVAAQIENHLNGMSNLLYMATTTSATGGISINLTYEVGTDLNDAIDEVLNRIYASMSLLPPVVQKLGVTARKSSPDQLMSVAFYSDPYLEPKFVSNYLQRTVENDLLLLPTVGTISVFGTGVFAIRVWLDPNKMQYYGVGVTDIQSVIKDQNQEFVIGRSNAPPSNDGASTMSINLKGSEMYSTPEQVANIVLKNSGNQIVRIKDVARVEMGASSYNTMSEIDFRDKNGKFNFYTSSIMQIYLVPNANQIEAKKQILQRLEQDEKSFPYGLHYRITNDNSRFVEASVHNVINTLYIAFVLVGIVILLFLQNWRASLIAICSIPVAIIGTLAFLYLFGFSLNTLSLFALVLAIGIVVDDAIVIIENIERLRNQYPDKKLSLIIELTLKEVMSAVIAIVLVLSVVFVPIMALGGVSGIMYRQFAVTIACAVVLSGVSALTFTPALSKLILKNHVKKIKLNKFDRGFQKLTDFYVKTAGKMIDHPKAACIVWLTIIVITIGIFKNVSTDFVPLEDQGVVMATINLPTSSSLGDTKATVNNLMEKLTKNPNIDSVLTIVGMDFLDSGGQKAYAASFFISLKDWKLRHGKNSSADSIIKQVNRLNKGLTGVTIRAFNQPPMRGLSTTGGAEFYLEDKVVGNPHILQGVADDLIKRLKKHKEIANSYQTLDTNVLQISLQPNIAMAKFYGVNLQDIYNAMQTMYSNNNVNFVYIMQDLAWIIMEADYPFRATIDGLRNVYVSNDRGIQVPIDSLVKESETRNAPVVQRFNGFIATKITVTPNKGYTLGDVIQVISSELVTIPKGYDYEWFGTSFQLKQSQKTSFIAFIAAFIMIYLVLAALFEMWRLPLVVLMGVPFALFGSGMILLVSMKPNDLYFQISLIALLGLSAKNIILLVEFALQHFNSGHSPKDSALHALRERFRPIVMTSVTFICGTLPLVFARGAGANAEHSVGLGIIGGIIGSVFLATTLTPAFFVLIIAKKKSSSDESY